MNKYSQIADTLPNSVASTAKLVPSTAKLAVKGSVVSVVAAVLSDEDHVVLPVAPTGADDPYVVPRAHATLSS